MPSRCSTRTRRKRRRCGPGGHRPARGELHGLHAVRPLVPRLVHLHRGPQGEGAAPPRGRQAPHGQRPRPLRHRLRAVHVLRHLRRGLPVRRLFWSPEYEYPSPASPICSTTRTSSVSGWRPCRRRPSSRPARTRRRSSRAARRPAERRRTHRLRHHRRRHDRRRRRVVTTSNIVHAALWLVTVLGGAAALYLLLAAEFVAVTQVLVYIGAVIVLFLFGIMLTAPASAARATWTTRTDHRRHRGVDAGRHHRLRPDRRVRRRPAARPSPSSPPPSR